MDLEWQFSHPVISSELALKIQDSIVDGFLVVVVDSSSYSTNSKRPRKDQDDHLLRNRKRLSAEMKCRPKTADVDDGERCFIYDSLH